MTDNICVISTALGAGAISIVRCSGEDVVNIVNKIFKGNDFTRNRRQNSENLRQDKRL